MTELTEPIPEWPQPGELCDGYRLIKPIGEGASGVVWLAEGPIPATKFAIKFLRHSHLPAQFTARFEIERRVLSRVTHPSHPNIATVYGSGTFKNRPFIVMEYVDGVSLDLFCDTHRLTIAERLNLFIQVCRAVHRAHINGIIHRDIKPNNIITSRDPTIGYVAKLIDFGICKPLESAESLTRHGATIGTIEYISPEQLACEPESGCVDTLVDVYALGVVLYHLLVGTLPFGLAVQMDEATFVRTVRTMDPLLPSCRVREADHELQHRWSMLRKTNSAALTACLAGDLDTIVMTALHRDRDLRYQSAPEIANDIERYLEQLPIQARSRDNFYLVRKRMRRHARSAVSLAVFAAMLVVGLVGALRQRRQVEVERDIARAERDNSQAVLNYLTNEMFAKATPEYMPNAEAREAVISQLIVPATAAIGSRFQDRPAIEAAIRSEVARTLIDVGKYDAACNEASQALSLVTGAMLETAPIGIEVRTVYACSLASAGRLHESVTHAEHAFSLSTRVLGDKHHATVNALAELARDLYLAGRYSDALPMFVDAIKRLDEVLGKDHPDSIATLNGYALLLDAVERKDDALEIMREALLRNERLQGMLHPHSIIALDNYACQLDSVGRFEEAGSKHRTAIEMCIAVFGQRHPTMLRALGNYGQHLLSTGRFGEASLLLGPLLPCREDLLGRLHPDTIKSRRLLAGALEGEGRIEEAKEQYQQWLSDQRLTLGDEHLLTIIAFVDVAVFARKHGYHQEARRCYHEAFSNSRKTLGNDAERTLTIQGNYGAFLLLQVDDATEARALLEDLVSRRVRIVGAHDIRTIKAMNVCGAALTRLGYDVEAERYQRSAFESVSAAVTDQAYRDKVASSQAACLEKLGRTDEALAIRSQIIAPATNMLEHADMVTTSTTSRQENDEVSAFIMRITKIACRDLEE